MVREPASPSRTSGITGFGRETAEDLAFHGFQARFLEEGIRALARAGDVGPDYTSFTIDVRSTVIARAMYRAADGSGDLCYPGGHAPGPSLAFGATPLEFLRHLACKGTSAGGAREGGLSWTDTRRGLIGWAGACGLMSQVLAGAALAFRQRKHSRAALAFEGSRALDAGGWHEGMNLAGALRAPLIVVLDVATAAAAECAPSIGAVAEGYGFAYAELGQDPFDALVREVAAARRRAVDGAGPTLLALGPRSDSEPWALHERFLESASAEWGLAGPELAAIERAARAGVDHAVARLVKEPSPDPSDALAPVHTDHEPFPPWTRREPPSPGPVEPQPGSAHVH
ncbi:MAG: thiamine pyrophosphate-dependent enzyme [Gemmatimonadetes bacterium]|nr:thiamine pyrophosphate-dependent enzyme [Gemmatimonadota bacterium]